AVGRAVGRRRPSPLRTPKPRRTGRTCRCPSGWTTSPKNESPVNWRRSRATARDFHAMATKTKTGSYAIIAVGGKQYVVHEGERLLVDRLGTDEGKTFHPNLLFVGGEGRAQLNPSATVTARVVGHVLGAKVRIGKYRPKSG